MASEVDKWGRECELSPPRLVHFDSWGCRVDHIVTSPAWKRMKDLSAQEGLVAIGYERSFGEWRLEAFAISLFMSCLSFFCIMTFMWRFLHMIMCGVCVLQSCVPNEQVVLVLSLLWTVHLSTGHD